MFAAGVLHPSASIDITHAFEVKVEMNAVEIKAELDDVKTMEHEPMFAAGVHVNEQQKSQQDESQQESQQDEPHTADDAAEQPELQLELDSDDSHMADSERSTYSTSYGDSEWESESRFRTLELFEEQAEWQHCQQPQQQQAFNSPPAAGGGGNIFIPPAGGGGNIFINVIYGSHNIVNGLSR